MAHGELLRAVSEDDELVYHLQHDDSLAQLDAQERAMLVYAHKLNFEPANVTQQDVQKLRDANFSDREILDIAMVVCLFNFMNRLADGLGIEIDPNIERKKNRADSRVEATLVPAAAGGS